MKNKFFVAFFLWLCLRFSSEFVHGETFKRDIVIYGNFSRDHAAVQVKKIGGRRRRVPDTHIGGLSSSSLGWTDSGRKEALVELPANSITVFSARYQSVESWKWQDMEKYGNRARHTRYRW